MITEDFFKTPKLDEVGDEIARNLPKGRAWDSKYVDTSITRGNILALGHGLREIHSKIEEVVQQFDFEEGESLIPEWLTSVGMPNKCYTQLSSEFLETFMTLERKRQDILDRIRRVPIVNHDEFKAFIISLMGYNPDDVFVWAGMERMHFPLKFPIILGGDRARFVVVVEIVKDQFSLYPGGDDVEHGVFPLVFPIRFTHPEIELLKCILKQILSANVFLVIKVIDERYT